MPPREELPLREEPELEDRPKPPDEGLLEELELPNDEEGLPDELEVLEEGRGEELVPAEEVLELEGVVENDRCDWVGLARTFALAAIFSAFGEVAGLEMTGCADVLTVEPAVRVLIDRV